MSYEKHNTLQRTFNEIVKRFREFKICLTIEFYNTKIKTIKKKYFNTSIGYKNVYLLEKFFRDGKKKKKMRTHIIVKLIQFSVRSESKQNPCYKNIFSHTRAIDRVVFFSLEFTPDGGFTREIKMIKKHKYCTFKRKPKV